MCNFPAICSKKSHLLTKSALYFLQRVTTQIGNCTYLKLIHQPHWIKTITNKIITLASRAAFVITFSSFLLQKNHFGPNKKINFAGIWEIRPSFTYTKQKYQFATFKSFSLTNQFTRNSLKRNLSTRLAPLNANISPLFNYRWSKD